MAAGTTMDDECRIYKNQFKELQVGQVVHTMAGNLRPRTKYVLHVVGPNANKSHDRQDCFKLVPSTILQCLEYTENILESESLSLPASSSGLFGVPKIDVAQAMYQALLKFDKKRPNQVKEFRIVNMDIGTTTVMEKEFKWWFGRTPKITEGYQDRPVTGGTGPLLLVIRSYQEESDTTNNMEDQKTKPTYKDNILLVRRKNKEYIPEKFTYFWRKESPFSQHFKCRITILG